MNRLTVILQTIQYNNYLHTIYTVLGIISNTVLFIEYGNGF